MHLAKPSSRFRENNHIVVIGRDGKVMSHFSAGAVTLEDVDLTDERGALLFTGTQADRKREPDAVKWIDDAHFATANEGDYEGGFARLDDLQQGRHRRLRFGHVV